MRHTENPKVFLSSTFVDLAAIRAEIIHWLSGIFGAQLIIMETFGSDADPPDIHSVRRVRECDLFIGIYAYRYGTIDQASGKSITELELDEARAALSAGVLRDILLYVIDDATDWLIEYGEENQVKQTGLKRLKDKSRQYTFTLFKRKEDLLFSIVRDVYRKSQEHFGTKPTTVRPFRLPSQKNLRQPVGMEFLTSEHRGYLFGRQQYVAQILELLEDNVIVLLLGDSGVGKTSLIHAGLIPKVIKSGFRPIYTRPFGLPYGDIVRQIQTSVFQGRPIERSSLVPLFAEISGALGDGRILLVIDQFEDVLIAREDRETELLVSELRAIRELATQSLRILISYRADLEGRLGEHWQKISGSPQGLPRMYVGGVDKSEAWNGVKQVCMDLLVNIDLRDIQQKRLMEDLFVASKPLGLQGVYPPYIQMLIDHIWVSSRKGKTKYRLKSYQEVGGMEGVIGGYLSRQLEYAQDIEGRVRAVLISLVRSYGVKAQRSMDEIVADTALNRRDCELAVERLIDLRLVRHIDTYYEVSHDFIARKIIAELVDTEEREFKRFHELLRTKAAAFQTTKAPLSSEELLMLYKHRNRVVPNAEELRLLLASWLLENGPALYWLLSTDSAKMLDWLRAEESKEDLTRDEKVSIILLRRKLGETALVTEDFSVFRGYQLSAEMSGLITEDPLLASRRLLMFGLRHIRAEVREASKTAVALQIKTGDLEWIGRLRKSRSLYFQQAYRELVLREDIPIPEEEEDEKRAIMEFRLLKKIAWSQTPSEATRLFQEFQKKHPPIRSLHFGKALAYIRTGRIKQLLNEVKRVSEEKVHALLAGISKQISEDDFDLLVGRYEEWNVKEQDREKRPAIYTKASACADTILRSISKERLPRLRRTMKKIRLTPSSRNIVLAFLKCAEPGDIELILNRIALDEEEIDFWNHTELGMTVARRLEESEGGISKFLRDILSREEFWEYISSKDRLNKPTEDLLPIINRYNRALYIRLAAYAMIGTAEKKDIEHLLRLTNHNYTLIARAASIRLVRLLREQALSLLIAKADAIIGEGKAKVLSQALRGAEIELYGVASLW